MIMGAHALLHTPQADEVRAFLRDVLGFDSVDAGHGWLIFALPPAELAVHPAEGESWFALYLMCDDLPATMAELEHKGVSFTRPVQEERWGSVTAIALPGGAELGLYQPRHPTALGLTGAGGPQPPGAPKQNP
ncbi:MAG TPA: VOC family protein [Thermoanaerobaculia bacterium]|nr:VOC family protein [Thermoanaerobaculia bacterium]